MADIRVHVHIPDGRTESIEAPANLKVGEFLDDLAAALKLGHRKWIVFDENAKSELDRKKTLDGNGVKPGDHLYLTQEQIPAIPSGVGDEVIDTSARRETTRCPRCGSEIDDSSKFCKTCGASLTPAPADAKLHIHRPDGRAYSIEVSVDLDVRELIVELIKAGFLPDIDSQGRQAQWEISDRAGGQALRQGLSLKQNGVGPGGHLYVTEKAVPPADLRLHIHRPEGWTYSIELSVDIDVGELIVELIKAGIVPGKDSRGRPVQWAISDRAGGQALQLGHRLKEYGIRPGDHLYVKELRLVRWKKQLAIGAGVAIAGIVAYVLWKLLHPPVPPPPNLSINPPRAVFSTSGSLQFVSNTDVQWNTDCPFSHISASGFYTYSAPAGPLNTTCAIRAVGANGSSATAQVALVHAVPPTPPLRVTINVIPTIASLRPEQRQQFKATVTGSDNTSVTWSIDPPRLGRIVPDGRHVVYTAPGEMNTRRTVALRATSQADRSKFATATVMLMPITVAGPPPPAPAPATTTPSPPQPAPSVGFGLVDILTSPSGKQVYVDGKAVGLSPVRSLRLIEGVHRFSWNGTCGNYMDTRVTANGYARVKLGCSQ